MPGLKKSGESSKQRGSIIVRRRVEKGASRRGLEKPPAWEGGEEKIEGLKGGLKGGLRSSRELQGGF